VLKESFLYLFASLINAFFSFLLIPIYTSYLSVEEFGIYGFLIVINLVFYMLISGNLVNLLSREFYKSQKKYYYIYSIIFYFVLVFSFLGCVVYLFGEKMLNFFEINVNVWYLYLILFIAFFRNVIDLYLSILRFRFLAVEYLKFSVLISFLTALFSYVFLIKYKVIGIFEGILIGYFFIVLFIVVRNFRFLKFNGRFLKEVIKFSFSYMPTTLSWRVITLSDRFFITKMVGVNALGLYTLSYQLSSVFNLFTTSINQAFSPFFMKSLQEKRDIKRVVFFLIVGMGAILFVGYFILEFVIGFLKKDYYFAIDYIKWFLGIVFFSFLHSIFSKYMIFHKKEKIISIITTIGAVLNIGLNIVLIKLYGGIGAVVATLLVYIFIVLAEFIYIKRKNYV